VGARFPLPHLFRVHTPFVGRADLGAPPGFRRATGAHRPLRLRLAFAFGPSFAIVIVIWQILYYDYTVETKHCNLFIKSGVFL